MADVRCPMCGKPNPDDLEVCQYCQARLKPLTAPLGESIHPGEEPTPKSTSELEAALPEWLRKLREPDADSERSEEPSDLPFAESPDDKTAQPPAEEGTDWLSGLAVQGAEDEEDEIPDWLAGLRGETAPAEKEQPQPEAQAEEADWMAGLRSAEAPPPPAGAESELPAWLSGLEGGTEDEGLPPLGEILEEQPAAPPAEETGAADWIAGLTMGTALSEPEPATGAGAEQQPLEAAGLPEWLSGLEEQPTPQESPAPAEELPDWLGGMSAESPASAAETPSAEGELPDWLAGMQAEEKPPAEPPPAGDLSGWFAQTDEKAETAASPPAAGAAEESQLPDWLAAAMGEPPAAAEQPPVSAELPDWLSGLQPEETGQVEQERPLEASELPDWLSGLPAEAAAQPVAQEQAPSPFEVQEVPDWLAALPSSEAASGVNPPPFSDQPPTSEGAASVFLEEPAAGDVESAFSMEMPDWLSAAEPLEARAEAGVPALEGEQIEPGALPSWVQAMRPVEAVISETGEAPEEGDLVTEGPLAGLRSVLPAGPAFVPTRKPQAFGLKLQAEEDQQANAMLLQQMLAGEAEPKPLISQPVLLSERLVRWVLSLLLILAVGLPLLTGRAFTPQASLFPNETLAAMQVVNELPEGAAVLLVFDYDVAFSGELEVASAPLVDHLMLRGARLAILSTTPVGPLLAERFLERTQAGHNYQAGLQYLNLGYLPGGAVGVLSFAQNPARSVPSAVDGSPAWETAVLQGVRELSDFDAVVVLSDHAEGAQGWVEQAGPRLGDTPLIMVVSAQAEPIIRPYFDAGQVKGLVSGLTGGNAYEAVNSRPGLGHRYQDSLSLGLFLTVLAVVVGGLWGLVGARRAAGEV